MPEIQKILLAVQQQIKQDFDMPEVELTLVSAMRTAWPNSCLGLAKSGEFCTQAMVDGWQITMRSSEQHFVYRTDANGNKVRLDKVLPFGYGREELSQQIEDSPPDEPTAPDNREDSEEHESDALRKLKFAISYKLMLKIVESGGGKWPADANIAFLAATKLCELSKLTEFDASQLLIILT